MLDPFLLLIYINDLFDNLQCNPKLFADDTSLFSIVKVPKRTANKLNNDLKEINKWAFQWSINPDATKQVQVVIFSRKTTKKIYPKILFNNIPVSIPDSQKHYHLQNFHKTTPTLWRCHLLIKLLIISSTRD